MTRFRFDGRVAVVTGAGRGVGRAHAHMLAEHGAKVVVNDLGGTTEGDGVDPGPAEDVVREITELGRTAIPDGNDISTIDGANELIATAVREFGRIDIVINNAGNMVWGGFPEADAALVQRHLNVHVLGSVNVTRAAWPHMIDQNYGRVVMTSSTGIFGVPDNLGYATSKAGLIGMAKSLTALAESLGRNIKVNCIAPAAATRLGAHPGDDLPGIPSSEQDAPLRMNPRYVAPMAAYLAHETCPVSGEVFMAGGGRYGRMFVGVNDGYLLPDSEKSSIEAVADHWDVINDITSFYIPANLMEWLDRFMSHL